MSEKFDSNGEIIAISDKILFLWRDRQEPIAADRLLQQSKPLTAEWSRFEPNGIFYDNRENSYAQHSITHSDCGHHIHYFLSPPVLLKPPIVLRSNATRIISILVYDTRSK